jgi:hypothetical protein
LYHAVLTTSNGKELYTCPSVYYDDYDLSLSAYPNPIRSGSTLTVKLPPTGGGAADGIGNSIGNNTVNSTGDEMLYVIDRRGVLFRSFAVPAGSEEYSIPVQLPEGVYAIRWGGKTLKVIVVK